MRGMETFKEILLEAASVEPHKQKKRTMWWNMEIKKKKPIWEKYLKKVEKNKNAYENCNVKSKAWEDLRNMMREEILSYYTSLARKSKNKQKSSQLGFGKHQPARNKYVDDLKRITSNKEGQAK